MDFDPLVDWLSRASPTQFFIGIAILVFGSKKILSERNVSESLGGLFLPFRWLRQRREEAADAEAARIARMNKEILRLQREQELLHQWAVEVTRSYRAVQLWAAEEGYTLPPPPFVSFASFRKRRDYPEEEDE